MALQPGITTTNRILVVEGDATVRNELEHRLQSARYTSVETGKTPETALQLLSSGEYDLIIIALSRPEKSGLAVVSGAVASATHTKVAVISGEEPTQQIGFEAGRLGASQMFEKPLNYSRVLIWVRGALKNPGSATSTRAHAFDSTLKENACIAGLSLDQLARKNNVTLDNMTRLFKKTFGMTTSQRRNYHQVENAKQLLSDRYLTLDEIAVRCGFRHASSFDRTFLRLAGMTPTKYRDGFG